MKVVFSKLALAELDEILAFLTPLNPRAAASVETHIGDNPEAARRVAQRRSVRRRPLVRYPYVIYCEAGKDEVTILRIRHARRRPLSNHE